MTTSTHPSPNSASEYERVTCDNVIWHKPSRQYRVCGRLVGKVRKGAAVSEVVQVTCSRCGKAYMLPRARVESDTAA